MLLEVLKGIPHAPSVQYSAAIPREREDAEAIGDESEVDPEKALEKSADVRVSLEEEDKRREDEREFYDGDKDNDGPEGTKKIKVQEVGQPMQI